MFPSRRVVAILMLIVGTGCALAAATTHEPVTPATPVSPNSSCVAETLAGSWLADDEDCQGLFVLEQPDKVDARRAELGMEPLAANLAGVGLTEPHEIDCRRSD